MNSPEAPTPEHPIQDVLFELGTQEERLERHLDYRILNDPDLRERYVYNTERLIARIIAHESDEVVFLDKSARPVAWMVRSLWPLLGIDDNGQHLPQPNMRFVNIDREQWQSIVGRSEDKDVGIDLNRIHPDTIDDLRGLFAKENIEAGTHTDEEADTLFDGKHVVIVDEVSASGDTLRMAEGMFEKAFPDASFEGQYWMTPRTKTTRGGVRANADLPVWYKDYDMHGRLVADRNIKASEVSDSMRQRRGAHFLSTRFPYADEEGRQLRQEAQQLAEEVSAGLIPVTPSSERSFEAQDAIMEDINGLSINEFATLKRESERTDESFRSLFVNYKLDKSKQAHPSSR